MKQQLRRHDRRLKLTLFGLGMLLMLVSYLIDNATELRPFLKLVASDYVYAKEAMDRFDNEPLAKIGRSEHSFSILLSLWKPQPPQGVINNTVDIARSEGMIGFGSPIRYQLRLFGGAEGKTLLSEKYDWDDYKAKEAIDGRLRKPIFWWKTIGFSVGFLLSLITGLTETKKPAGATACALHKRSGTLHGGGKRLSADDGKC